MMAGMPFFRDRPGLEVLDRGACLRLLAGAGVGRIGLSMDALPVVLPVNYVLDADRILIRTGSGTKLNAALRNAVVCFEVDDLHPEERSGWSVLVTGTAQQLTGAEAEAAMAALDPWSPAGDHVMAIPIQLVSGRRVGSLAAVAVSS